jgi:Calcineurin-like phosphoesterase
MMKKTLMTRRRLLQGLSLLGASLPLRGWALPFRSTQEFKFVFLGDIHFDKLGFHDPQYIKTKYPHDLSQIENYSRITRENLSSLMDVSKAHARKTDSKFFLQIGDFVEGLCGSKELAGEQTTEFINYIDQQNLERPFIAIKGNHDITGTGAKDIYQEIVLPWQSRELAMPLNSANNVYVHNKARFILFDCFTEAESLVWLREVIKEHKPDETLFFCTHIPVVPYNARSNWHIYVHPEQAEQREEIMNLLGAHNAIVLSGHLHKTSVVVRNTPSGNFVQVGLGSVVPALNAPVKDHLKGLDAYNASLVNLEPDFSPSSLEVRKQILEKEKPYIRYFEYADFCGYASIAVKRQNEVEITYFANADQASWQKFNLTQLLKN